MDEKNIVFIGKKVTTTYATSALILSKDYNVVYFAARGNNIPKAIDAAWLTKRRFLNDWVVHANEVIIGSEIYDVDGQNRYVSTIKVRISKDEVKSTP